MAGGMINFVQILETRPADVTIRRWREIRRGVMQLMGLHWHKHMLPEHFKANAANVYHYRQRTRDYLKRKAWFTAKGHGITSQEIMDETIRSMPAGLKASRGFYEDIFWRQYRLTRARMLDQIGASPNPLQYTGNLRANVTQFATIRVFEQRFKLVMPGTPYTPDRPRTPKQPPIAQEVTRLLEREKAELSRLGKAFAGEALKAIKSPTTTTIR